MKIHPVGAEFYADGWTDMTKRIVAFRNFAKAPKNHYLVLQMQLGISCVEFGRMTECNPCCNNYWPAVHTRITLAYLLDSVPYFRALCTDDRRAAYLLRNKYEDRKGVECLPLQERTNGAVFWIKVLCSQEPLLSPYEHRCNSCFL
jgi:hypothetical protein